MRLLWIYIFTLAFILAIVFQDVNGDELHKKGPGNKGMINRDDGTHKHHPDVGRAGSPPGGPGDHKIPSNGRSPSHNRDRSGSSGRGSSSDRHSDKSSHKDRKHKDKKQGKNKHNKHKQGKKHNRDGKNSHH